MSQSNTRLGRGIYSIPEASRLTRVSSQRIRGWLHGSRYQIKREKRTSQPVIAADYARSGGAVSLSFLDLIEVRFINEFRGAGVGWKAIRVASARAREILRQGHPFSTKRFRTDGKTILLEIARESGQLHCLVSPPPDSNA
jgi:hypothetical protein